jgi:pyruvate ferredoxin oxidoreductase gamma subunit
MYQVRFHGRGGQGVVTAAELLSVAAFDEGRHSQAFPSFGSERTGAPVVAFCRIGDHPIRLREPIVAPDAVVIQDPTLLHHVDVFSGLAAAGLVLINTSRPLAELGLEELAASRTIRTVPATEIAMQHVGKPLPNAALLGALAAASGCIRLESLCSAIRERFSARIADGNVAAAVAAFDFLGSGTREADHAQAG